MTPPPAATEAATAGAIPSRSRSVDLPGAATLRALATHNWPRLRSGVDAIVLWMAAGVAVLADGHLRLNLTNHLLAAAFPLVVMAAMHARPGPDDRLGSTTVDIASHVAGIVSLSAMLMIALDSILGGEHPVSLSLRLWLFGFVYLATARAVLASVRRHALRAGRLITPTVIVGAGVVGERLVSRLVSEPGYGLLPVGFVDTDPLRADELPAEQSVPVLGSLTDLAAVVAETGVRKVILAFSSDPDHLLVEQLERCRAMGVEVALVPRMYELINERSTLGRVGGLPLLSLHPTNPRSWGFAFKHALDRGLSALALGALLPLIAAIAIAIKLSSPGPVLFRQRRVGRDGHVFDLLKFRTMRDPSPEDVERFVLVDGCAPGGVEGHDRRTAIGRLLRGSSLDELPQLINVLRGDMSLVGPRPERPEFVALFRDAVDRYDHRHRVKSGITGWAQVHGLRGPTSIADRVEWDNYYIQNWSLALDLRILAMTVFEVLRFRERG
jgi:exopolysaccharide biosynthesis polyprenyl glycosylphosphotransferase